jgi:HEAT repeat protein
MSDLQLAKELSARGLAAAKWFRQLARCLKIIRIYGDQANDFTMSATAQIGDALQELLAEGSLEFKVGPSEIHLDEEAVVRVRKKRSGSDEDVWHKPEEELPFRMYQDGIRSIHIHAGISPPELEILLRALSTLGNIADKQDDVVTLLWQENMQHVQVEAAPLEQTIHLSSRRAGSGGGGGSHGQGFAAAGVGDELRADLGQVRGAQGLHRDTFDDWELPAERADPIECYMMLLPEMESARAQFEIDWVQEWLGDWTREAPEVLRQILAFDSGRNTRRSIAHLLITWIALALQKREWRQAREALEQLRDIDPQRTLSDPVLLDALSALDSDEMAMSLDEANSEDQAMFLSLMVAIGRPALDFALAVLAHARRGRLRAVTCTALAYMCDERPEVLEMYLTDHRWYVARNVVFILGQIGGPNVVEMLRTASEHFDLRVKRAVVHSLGAITHRQRYPILISLLDSKDTQLVSAALGMLARERNQEVARYLIEQISSHSFDSRPEKWQRAFLNALGEAAEDENLPELEKLLHEGGWFAQHTVRRSGIARALRHLGTDKALAVLEQGLCSRSEPVRAVCLTAIDMGDAA